MPSFAQKRTIIVAIVVVFCTFVILRQTKTKTTTDIRAESSVIKFLKWPGEFTSAVSSMFNGQSIPSMAQIPETTILQNMKLGEISDLYFRYVNTLQVFCPVKNIYGGVRSGWYTCEVATKADQPCVSYMITSKEKDAIVDAFFKEIGQDYKCEKNVILNSTMTAEKNSPDTDATSSVAVLKSKKHVDYMVMDVQGGETQLLSFMLKNGLLRTVGQLIVTFHGIKADSNEAVYVEHLQVLRALYQEGYRTFHFNRQIQCLFSGNPMKTGCYTLSMMREMPIHGPLEVFTPELIKTQPLNALASLYHKLLVSTQVHCKEVVRIGKVDDGGWDICNDTEYRPSSPCIVYSFGVAGDWSFDDEVSRIYGCEVHSFDPSIGKQDHKRSDKITFHNLGLWGKPKGQHGKWKMMNLEGIMQMLGHTNKKIDIIKMDIESSEWSAIPDMISTGVLKKARQFNVEFHNNHNPHESFRSKMSILRGINDQGLKLFWSHPNTYNVKQFGPTGRQVTACYENYYLNPNLKKTNA
ncbi:uncharacterized protein LOC110453558 isoform X2 [Mizuhopecten yessoensis]|uniref:Methyltransferase-like protein 24 n=1 Tax=Mizuhopecten yessoensis TaxID=6573 RepID=A0A210QH98_MIZYE|nr:uncharacterized protein LOC110453558 isoform X1 [Mizuhopecten yessoensis]XP_021358210.1 uncharacterized protein LOC110453558 isoform X2 [Mizuhopecten yessoensis]OWF48086.1 Methyltransferase-like protein 24 [Mizuhopecten yessoensis]